MPVMPPSYYFIQLLNGAAALTDWTVEGGLEKDKPDKFIAIIDTGGLPANPKWLLDFPSIQVTVRGPENEYVNTWTAAKAVKDLCLGAPSQDINGDRLVSVTLASDIFYLGRDGTQRHKFTINFRLITEPATSTETNRLPL